MNEPKKRGRPSKADIAAREQAGQVPQMNGDASVGVLTPSAQAALTEMVTRARALDAAVAAPDVADDSAERAQAYAMRVWAGQSASLGRGERITRIERALQGQNLPTDGVKYPGGADSDDDWTAEDEQPVTWRKAQA